MKILKTLGLVAVIAMVALIPVGAQGPPGSWTTDFTVLNLADSEAAVNITRYAECDPPCTADAGTLITSTVIPANGSFYYNPANDPAFPTSFGGSVVMSSDQPLAATVTVGNDLTGVAYASDAYAGVSEVSDAVFLPIVMGNLGVWNTRMAIQNAGSTDADVTITYIGAGAPAATTIDDLPPNMTALVDQQENLGMSNFNGSALVTTVGGQELAIVVDEYKSSGGVLVSYVGVPQAKADMTVYMPGYISWGPWQTDFTVVNTEAQTATVNIAFSGVANTLSFDVPPNGAAYTNAYAGYYPAGAVGSAPTSLVADYYGSATVTADRDIVLVYNEANSAGVGNLNLGYVAPTGADGAMEVAMPLVMNQAYGGGWNTTYSVQVLGGGPASLEMSYSGTSGTALCDPCTMVITDSATINFGVVSHISTDFAGGVIVSSDVDVVLIGDQAGTGTGDTSAGFPGVPLD